MTTLNQRIKELEKTIEELKHKVRDLSDNVEEKSVKPYSKVGGQRDRAQIRSSDISSGLGQLFGGNTVWNDSELKLPPYGQKPSNPTKAYNRHSHSRFSGGALDINTLELVQYDCDWNTGIWNKDCQGFWKVYPSIAKEKKANGIEIEKIGNLEITFDPEKGKWVAGSGWIKYFISNDRLEVKYNNIITGATNPLPAITKGYNRHSHADDYHGGYSYACYYPEHKRNAITEECFEIKG